VRGAPGVESALGRTHGDEVVEAVAVVDAHVVGDGSQAVGRIEIAVVRGKWRATPEPLAAVLEEQAPEIVEVGAFAVQEIAKQAVTNHVDGHQFGLAVATVFEHEAMAARHLGRVYKSPAVLDGAAGTSTMACLPLFMAAIACGTCQSHGVAI
jgi:hypothetical protein